jgi:tetratricopeptide (TPR) repeat protein
MAYPEAHTSAAEALATSEAAGDRAGMTRALFLLALAQLGLRDLGAARSSAERSLALARERGDQVGIGDALLARAVVARRQGDRASARTLLEESLSIARALGDRVGRAYALTMLGELARLDGDLPRAEAHYEASLLVWRRRGKAGVAAALHSLGWVALNRGDNAVAAARFAESLGLCRDQRYIQLGALCLVGLAGVLHARGQPERASHLVGAADVLLDSVGSPLDVADQAEYDRTHASLRMALGEDRFAAARNEGRALSFDAAIALALDQTAGTAASGIARRRLDP